jgi:hypothetical protein
MFSPTEATAAYNETESLKISDLESAVGGLSKPSKMPWLSYSIPASRCKVGSTLRKVPGSTCASCYACKGRYTFANVQEALDRRVASLDVDVNRWAGTMRALLERKARGQARDFRWHDSGDLQGQAHLDAIIWIAESLPHVRFWLPSREYGLVRANVDRLQGIPNLTVRISAPMVGLSLNGNGLPTSTVGRDKDGFQCPAVSTGSGKCGDCRACWDPSIPNVNYPLH